MKDAFCLFTKLLKVCCLGQFSVIINIKENASVIHLRDFLACERCNRYESRC